MLHFLMGQCHFMEFCYDGSRIPLGIETSSFGTLNMQNAQHYLHFTTHEAACVILCRVSMYICLYVFRKSWCMNFILAHVVYFHGLRVYFVYEVDQVKVKVTGAKKCEMWSATCMLKWQNDYNWRNSKHIPSLRGVAQTTQWEIPCIISLPAYTQWPGVMNCTHSQVFCLRLEGNLVAVHCGAVWSKHFIVQLCWMSLTHVLMLWLCIALITFYGVVSFKKFSSFPDALTFTLSLSLSLSRCYLVSDIDNNSPPVCLILHWL